MEFIFLKSLRKDSCKACLTLGDSFDTNMNEIPPHEYLPWIMHCTGCLHCLVVIVSTIIHMIKMIFRMLITIARILCLLQGLEPQSSYQCSYDFRVLLMSVIHLFFLMSKDKILVHKCIIMSGWGRC